MNKTYIILETDLKKALDQIDNFKTKIEMFSKKYSRFEHEVTVNKKNKEWLILLNIKTKDEQSNTKAS